MPLVRDKVVEYPKDIDFSKQSVEVPGTRRSGQTGHYRNAIWGLLNGETPGALRTLDQIFDLGIKAGRDSDFLGHRPLISTNPLKFAPRYVWQTWGQVDERRRLVGSALSHLFSRGELGGGEYETVGIWSQNRPEWQIVDLALHAYNKVGVSIYDTLGKDSVEYIIDHAYLSVVFSTSDHLPTLLRVKPKVSMLKMIVCIDALTPESKGILSQWGQSLGVRVIEMSELEALGKANLTEPVPAKPEQLASICYTSGTTSNPKGVLLTHEMLALATQSNLHGLPLPDDGVILSYLPLAHIYERIAELACVACGARIGYFTGDPLRLLEDAQILKPNFMPSVPRVLNRIYQAAMTAGNTPGMKGALFRRAVQTKMEALRSTGAVTHAFWDRLVFRKVQAVLGGGLMLVTCGSAPIHADVLDFLKIALACDVVEGYGMTETCATASKSTPGDPSASGTVGPPSPVNEVKLVDVPAMNYTSQDKPNPRGELCVRGANCMKAYYKDEKNTRETVDEEGWLHTGDIAEIDSCGRIKIIDRVKNIMKLAQGEYVALEKIENTYSSSPVVSQLYVHGDSLQSYLLGVVVPDPIQLATIASSVTGRKVSPTDNDALAAACQSEAVKSAIMNALNVEAKRAGLKGFEMLKRIHLSIVPFSIENNTLTPTFKIRRKDAYNMYKAELDALYALGEPSSNSSKL
ncbi:medium-chain fatty acid-CoA ligase faa2 [Stygiomarasmius scandens]|uniref:Medium-chain fatty acid-CoA ligase faa2 n=1 Tax=Marasmiellus scandens TaxID=2682957 RepID=A0ABR1ISL2_9AGAR